MLNMTDETRIRSLKPLISPALLMEEFPSSATAMETVINARNLGERIIKGQDDRLLVVVGPCSIHDPQAALEYAQLLKTYHDELKNDLLIIMRIYFEKPRTTIGWKGLINDPQLDGSFDINQGLKASRKLLIDVADLGLPTASEFLDTIVPQYLSDLVSWGAIGARTTESQLHRELASGLSMPVGFKNGTRGNIQIAIDAIRAARHPHHFLSITNQGLAAIVSTSGNDACHVILRGSNEGSNYSSDVIKQTVLDLKQADVSRQLMIDCSHGNSNKDHRRQSAVVQSVCEQVSQGDDSICGVMIESNLAAGKQRLTDKTNLRYGISITDACVGWEETVPLLLQLAESVQKRREQRHD